MGEPIGAGSTWWVCLDVTVPGGVSGPQTVQWDLDGTGLSEINGSLNIGPCSSPTIPTLSPWGLMLLSLILAVTAIQVMRRRRGTT